MRDEQRSGCPINLTMEALGDRWSLIVIRDVMFGNRRSFRDLLNQSEEGIASNILSARLKHLVSLGLLTKQEDPRHSQKAIYSLTEPAIQLVPVLAAIGAWGRRHLEVSEALAIRAQLLEEGGPSMWNEFMDDLRVLHINDPVGGATGALRSAVLDHLTEAFLKLARKRAGKKPATKK